MAEKTETYPIEIGGVKRDLRLFEIKPGLEDRHHQYPGRHGTGDRLRV